MAEEDPDRPFSAVRVAIWALGVLGLILAVTLAMLAFRGQPIPRGITTALAAIIGGLTMAAGRKL